MTYRIEYTGRAQDDLDEIYRYIAFTLIAPDTAANMIRLIFESIHTLDSLPLRNPLIDDSPWKERGLRKLYVKNYIVFYTVYDTAVRIIRVMYGGRNIADQLKDVKERRAKSSIRATQILGDSNRICYLITAPTF